MKCRFWREEHSNFVLNFYNLPSRNQGHFWSLIASSGQIESNCYFLFILWIFSPASTRVHSVVTFRACSGGQISVENSRNGWRTIRSSPSDNLLWSSAGLITGAQFQKNSSWRCLCNVQVSTICSIRRGNTNRTCFWWRNLWIPQTAQL